MIATLSEIKANLGLTDTQDDALLATAITALEGRFDAHLNRALARSENVVEQLHGGAMSLWLKRFPLESVASIYVSADHEWIAANLLDVTDYTIVEEEGRIVYGYGIECWPAGVGNIRVTYTGGYVAAGTAPSAGQTALPEAIRGAFFMQFAFEWRNRSSLGATSVSAQGASINLAPAALLPEVKSVLAPFWRF